MLHLAIVLAPTTPVTLDFRGDAGCDAAVFERSLAAHLTGSDATRPVGVTLTATASSEISWSAELELDVAGARSSRRFRGGSCEEVVDAAAFVTAIVVDPDVLARSQGALVPMPEPVPPAPQPISPVPSPAPPPSHTADPLPPDDEPAASAEPAQPEPPPPARRVGGFLRLAGGFEALGAPRVGPQFTGAIGLLGRAWRVELTGMYRAPTQQLYPDNIGAKVRVWTLGARGCGVLRPGPLEIPLCLGVEAGQAIGHGLPTPRRDAIPWFAPVVGSAIAWAPRRWFAVWLGVDLAFVVPGERFSIGSHVIKSALVSPRAALGLELRIP